MTVKITDEMVDAAQMVFTSWGYSASNTECLRAALTAALAALDEGQKAEPVAWRTDATPKDGTPIYIRVIQPFRYLPYKPNSQQAQRGDKGRWQMMNEYGGWENCPHPLGNEWCRDPFRAALQPS